MDKITNAKHTPLTPRSREWVLILRNEVIPQIPRDRFNMSAYFADIGKAKGHIYTHPTTALEKVHECGTAACLAGYLLMHPKVGPLFNLGLPFSVENVLKSIFEKQERHIHECLFDMDYRNSIEDAIERIDYLLEYGLPSVSIEEEKPLPVEWNHKFKEHY